MSLLDCRLVCPQSYGLELGHPLFRNLWVPRHKGLPGKDVPAPTETAEATQTSTKHVLSNQLGHKAHQE